MLTPDNVGEWVKIAQENNTLQLIDIVANHKKARAPQAIEDQSSKTVTALTFKVHDGQKEVIQAAIEKGKSEAGTQVATVALENICQDYLSGATYEQKTKQMGLEAALKVVEKCFPNASIGVTLADDAQAA